MKIKNILKIKKLAIAFGNRKKSTEVVHNISFGISENEILGIVGESGSGKSVTSLAIMGLLPEKNTFLKGEVFFKTQNLLNKSKKDIRKLRGSEIAMIFQEPMSALNPSIICGLQVSEVFRHHLNYSASKAKKETLSLFEKVKLPRPKELYNSYPHQISGGQMQRVMIAMAIACKPKLLIADEPTTALDVTVQKEIILLLKDLQKETKITKTVDPWAGSYYIEKLTHEIAEKAWSHIEEVESLGGMTSAIKSGVPKLRIEEAAARKQARIDSGQDIIVGVNKFQLKTEDLLHILEVDNELVRAQQIDRLNHIKSTRDIKKVKNILENLTKAASDGSGNLLALAVEAARLRATLGEISDALEQKFGRYKAETKTFSGVYSKEIKNDVSFEKARKLADQFSKNEGRRPRIMIAKMGQDGHDRGAKVVATGYADLGFDVDIGPLFQTAEEAAKQAVENDVHILGVSSLAGGHKTLVPKVIDALKAYGRDDIMVIVGGVIPKQDYRYLFDAGTIAVFGPGTKISDTAISVLEILIN